MGKRKYSRKSHSPIPSVQTGPIVARIERTKKTRLTQTELEGLSVSKLEKTTLQHREILGTIVPKNPEKTKKMKARNKKTQSEKIREKTAEFATLANSVNLSEKG
jgi:hypothetical protein